MRIVPDPIVCTYMVGYSIWQVRRRMESGAAKVVIPPEYLSSTAPPLLEGGRPSS